MSRFLTPYISMFSIGLFLESRHVECSDPEGNANDLELCDESKKPEIVRDCETENPEVCENFWVATQWSTCSSKCQNITGIQTRKVYCATKEENTTISILEDESLCSEESK